MIWLVSRCGALDVETVVAGTGTSLYCYSTLFIYLAFDSRCENDTLGV